MRESDKFLHVKRFQGDAQVEINTLSRWGQWASEVFVRMLHETVWAVQTVEKECRYTCPDVEKNDVEHCLDCHVADLERDHYESDEQQLNLQVHIHVHGSQLLQQLLFQN